MIAEPIYLDNYEHADCCGRSHLCSFPDRVSLRHIWGIPRSATFTAETKRRLKQVVKEGLQEAYDNNVSGNKRPGHVVEVTLTDKQAEVWEDILLGFGFDKIMRFRNHKSGNYVNIYLNNIGRYAVRRKIGKV